MLKNIFVYLIFSLLILPIVFFYTRFNKVTIIFVPNYPQGYFAHSLDLFFRKQQFASTNGKVFLLARSISYIDGYPKSQLLLMFKRLSTGVDNVFMCTNSIVQDIMYKVKVLYGHMVTFERLTTEFHEHEYINSLPMASFTCSEISKATNQLKLFGIDPINDRIVSVFARDSDYKNDVAKKESLDYRNSDINSFIPAIKYLVNKGYKVVRIGSYSKREIHYSNNLFFDYTMSGKTNTLLDVFLLYISKLVIGTSSGGTDPAHLFNTPVLYIDYVPFLSIPFSNKYYDSYIPKKIVNSETGRVVKFSSIVDKIKPKKDVRWAVDEEYLQDEFGLRFIDNTENEILEGVIEIESRLLCNQFVDVENSDIAKLYYQYLDKNKSNSLRTLPSLTWLEKNIDLYID